MAVIISNVKAVHLVDGRRVEEPIRDQRLTRVASMVSRALQSRNIIARVNVKDNEVRISNMKLWLGGDRYRPVSNSEQISLSQLIKSSLQQLNVGATVRQR